MGRLGLCRLLSMACSDWISIGAWVESRPALFVDHVCPLRTLSHIVTEEELHVCTLYVGARIFRA